MSSRLCLLAVVPPLLALLLVFGRAPTPSLSAADTKSPTFAKDGVAFLAKHCLGCHGEKTKKADLSLHTFKDESSLVKNRKLWQHVVNQIKTGEMPPPTRKRPTRDEVDNFLALVREVFARADKDAKPDPGRVTVRRLNRTEYNNTIRDLVGVDFNPAEDFPSDDIGHGFDNIGDVLTLSPVLMERYLAAAESIMQRAIVVTPPAPPQRYIGGRYLEPAQPKELKYRPIDPRGNVLHTPYKLSLRGEYTFRIRAYAKLTDKEPVKIAILNGEKELKQFEVTAPKEKPVTLEVKTDLPKGDHRFFVALLNPDKGVDGRNLHVEWFNLNGPSDTRPESQRRLLAVTPGKSKAEQTRKALTRFARGAYRRTPTTDEIDRLTRLVESAEKRGEKWESAMQLAFQAVLVSPKFLFRLELDDRPSEQKPHAIEDFALASRLSYFLWSTMPDEELLALAEKKELSRNVEAQVRRMLKDSKASALVDNFAMQWLQLRRLQSHAPDDKLFPGFNEKLRKAMLRETELFLTEIIREDRSILDLIDGKFTYLNGPLARHYRIRDTVGNVVGDKKAKPGGKAIPEREFVRVELNNAERGGLLTHASILTVTSNPTRTSPVKRGKWVLEQLLGTPPPPPPPDVPELEDEKKELTGSLRQRMEQHRTNPACANCHAKMDPLGFAFENYDAIGAYRWKDGKHDIDASGELPGGLKFQGPQQLKAILKDKKDLFARCVTEKMLTYALGRGLEHYDDPAVDSINKALAKGEYKFSVLVTEIARSFPFRMRRGKEVAKTP